YDFVLTFPQSHHCSPPNSDRMEAFLPRSHRDVNAIPMLKSIQVQSGSWIGYQKLFEAGRCRQSANEETARLSGSLGPRSSGLDFRVGSCTKAPFLDARISGLEKSA